MTGAGSILSVTRTATDTLIVQTTVVDPKAYTKPWVGVPRNHKLRPNWELEESYCAIDDEQNYFKGVTSGGQFSRVQVVGENTQ